MKNGNKLIMSNFLNKKDNMYIRRKVFSLVEDQENNYEMEERLYSTGDVELDELLERAFCEGYEFAQKEFADEAEGALAGIGATGAALGAGYAGLKGIEKAGGAMRSRRIAKNKKALQNVIDEKLSKDKALKKKLEEISKTQAEYEGLPGDAAGHAENRTAAAKKAATEKAKASKAYKSALKNQKSAGKVERILKKAGIGARKAEKLVRENKKVAGLAALGVTAAAATGGAIKNHFKD